ncbi:hypothetical protein PRUPE_2G054200 [Prunus persica]|uniref:Rx N-terminal domain-containing protein n=1 Tax=Prunus persica TaxID=3760 RepID=A0A251QCU6_PRUPE|nr:hypothetical protein PRUPE_2G054200 [Prunus persica]
MLFTISKSFHTCLQTCISKFCKPWNITSSKSPSKAGKMAAALIGEALISASIELLCDRVTSAEFIDLFQQKKLDETLLMNLKTTLLILFAVLNDSEEKQIVNPAVREWLNSSSMLSLMQRTYLMRLTLKLCDASWKEKEYEAFCRNCGSVFLINLTFQLWWPFSHFSFGGRMRERPAKTWPTGIAVAREEREREIFIKPFLPKLRLCN